MDSNGVVNILNARLLINYVSHPGYPIDSWAGDVTGGGVLFAVAAVLIITVLNF